MNLDKIIELDKKYYMNTYGDRLPVAFEYGEGSKLYDKDGKCYIDFLAGIAVNVLGYRHPLLVSMLTEQVKKLLHCSNYFYIESQAKLAQMIAEHSCAERIFFCNSGAEANEGAIKLARKYFRKKGLNKYEIISATNSFHGRTLATLAATGQPKYREPFKPLPPGFKNVPYNDIEAVKNAISDNTCAIIVEPIQGEGGVIEATEEYIKGLREICTKNNILLIFDEVQTGMGRTGKLFGYQHFNVEPDIFTLAKALGGGIPIGAIAAKGEVGLAFEPGDHGTTFGGNPLACTAGIAVMTALLDEDLVKQSEHKGEYFKKRLNELKNEFPFIKEVRGRGLMLGMQLEENINGKEIVKMALKKGFIINCAGHNTLRFVPPLVISAEEIDMLIEALRDIFKQF